jgi:hypothetical protein
MHFCLPNIINVVDTQYLTEVILPSIQNIVGICKQITIRIFHQVCSMFITNLKFIYASIYVFFVLTVCFRLIIFFTYSLFLFLKVLLVLCLTFFRFPQFGWLGFRNHCNLACFLWYNHSEHSSSKNGLCCFNSL